ncbi:response regulator [bacterium]|nr:response regulator [bacterium]
MTDEPEASKSPGQNRLDAPFWIFDSEISDESNPSDQTCEKSPCPAVRQQLEALVAERTADLAASIELLEEEAKERRATQAELEARNETLQTLIDNIPVMLTFYDAVGHFSMCNRECENRLGYSAAEFSDMDVMQACFPDPEYRREAWDYMAAAQPGWKDLILTTKFGTQLQSRWANVRLSDSSQIGIGIDVSETKRYETEAVRKHELSEQRALQLQELALELSQTEQRERERLAEVLHDDLQQLLAGARFQLGTLLNRPAMNDSGMRSLRRIADLLDESIAKSRNLAHELSPPVLKQGGLTAGLQWLVRQKRHKYAMNVQLKTEGEIEPLSVSIRAFLFRAVQEMLTNVIKHAGTDSATVGLSREGENLCLTVEDQGRGFDPADLKTSGGSAPGFGLLSIIERTNYLGGTLEIHSEPETGSCFCLTMPMAICREVDGGAGFELTFEHSCPPEEPQTPPDPGSIIQVLLVDDHKVMREGLAVLLEDEEDVEVIGQAGDGVRAIEEYRRLRPDVVIMDCAMPRMDGIEATRRIRAEDPDAYIVGLSMFEEADLAHRMERAGAAAYINKANAADNLLHAIRSCRKI